MKNYCCSLIIFVFFYTFTIFIIPIGKGMNTSDVSIEKLLNLIILNKDTNKYEESDRLKTEKIIDNDNKSQKLNQNNNIRKQLVLGKGKNNNKGLSNLGKFLNNNNRNFIRRSAIDEDVTKMKAI